MFHIEGLPRSFTTEVEDQNVNPVLLLSQHYAHKSYSLKLIQSTNPGLKTHHSVLMEVDDVPSEVRTTQVTFHSFGGSGYQMLDHPESIVLRLSAFG